MRSLFFVLLLLLGMPVKGKDMMDTRTYGAEAPTRMYLFTSLVCPHCATFHKDILPEIQKKYLAPQLGQIVIVDMLMNKPNLMGAMLLRCVPAEKTEQIENILYKNQRHWAFDEDKARAYLGEIALRNGMSAGDFETCLNNKDLENSLIKEQERFSKLYGVSRMPTLLVPQNESVFVWEGADKETVMSGLSDFFK